MHAPLRCPPLVAYGLICALPLLCTFPDRATARPITFAFEGIVENVVDFSYTIYPDYVDYGDTFSGTFTFESTTPGTVMSTWRVHYLNSVLSLQGHVGEVDFSEFPPIASNIEVVNDLPQGVLRKVDSYLVSARIDLFGHPSSFGIGFDDSSGTALDSSLLPEGPPVFDGFRFAFQWLDSGTGIDGSVTSFTLVPEPGGLLMIVLGAMAALARRRRGGSSILAAVVAAAALACPAAQARPITFAFEGIVENVVDSSYTIYPDYVDYGDSFSGTFTFESTTPRTVISAWEVRYLNSVIVLRGAVGEVAFTDSLSMTNKIQIVDDFPLGVLRKLDEYVMVATIELFGHPTKFEIGFDDYTGSSLDSLALPETPPQHEDLMFRFQWLDSGTGIDGSVTSFTLAPEPGGLLMTVLSATAALARRRARLSEEAPGIAPRRYRNRPNSTAQ